LFIQQNASSLLFYGYCVYFVVTIKKTSTSFWPNYLFYKSKSPKTPIYKRSLQPWMGWRKSTTPRWPKNHREKEHLIFMWILGHAGIQGNEKTDRHAKAALQVETNKNFKIVAEDWKNWIRAKQERIRQPDLTTRW
jgi:hypothetical protein